MKNSMIKDRAKEKAQNMKKILNSLGHDVGIRHCYELIARTNGFESWNAMSANLEVDNVVYTPASYGNDTPTLESAEPTNEFDLEIRATAQVKRIITVGAENLEEAYNKVKNLVNSAEGDFWSGEDWEVDSHIGYADYPYEEDRSIHSDRKVVITDISTLNKHDQLLEIQDEEGIKEDDPKLKNPPEYSSIGRMFSVNQLESSSDVEWQTDKFSARVYKEEGKWTGSVSIINEETGEDDTFYLGFYGPKEEAITRVNKLIESKLNCSYCGGSGCYECAHPGPESFK